MKRFRKTKSRKMKSVEIELSQWVKFNEQNEQEAIQKRTEGLNQKETANQKKTVPGKREETALLDNAQESPALSPALRPVKLSEGIQKRERKQAIPEAEKGTEGIQRRERKQAAPEAEKGTEGIQKRERKQAAPEAEKGTEGIQRRERKQAAPEAEKGTEGIQKRERKKVVPQPERGSRQESDEAREEDGAWKTKRDYALVRKDRIIKSSEELEQLKKEYRVLAEYHNDISRLQDLPDGGTQRVKDTAGVIIRLQNDRKAFQEDMTRLDDAKYLQMSKYTEDMPDVIRRLTSDELYVSKLKKQIDDLEGEKGEQQYESKAVEANQGKMKNLSVAGMFLLLVLFGVLLILQLQFDMDTQIYTLLCGIAFAVMTLAVFIRYFNNVNRAKKTEYQLNKIISKQNKVKIKYVNALNGVDSVYRRYQVHSASELLFQWEQFIMTKKAMENYQRSGNEIIYYTERLQKQLEQYRIQDPGMWMNQIECLADEQKMNSLKKDLESKVEEAKKKIDNCRRAIQKAKDDISLLAIRNPQYADAIRELTEVTKADLKTP